MTTAPRRPATDRLSLGLPPGLTTRADGPFALPELLAGLVGRGPVHRLAAADGGPLWLITGYDEARAALADRRLSSDRFRSERVIASLPERFRERVTDPRRRAGNFLTLDPPAHTRYRRLLTGRFTVRRMRALTTRVEEVVTAHLDAVVAGGTTADLVPAFALPVPSLVICELLGVDHADRHEFQERTSTLLRLDTPLDEVARTADGLRAFLLDLVGRKRAAPADDVLSGLVRTDPTLTDDELVGIANLLLVAGHETTANALALGAFALLEHPDQLARLREDPALVGGAVEELLRHLSIINLGVPRLALEEVEIAGEVIPADSDVLISVIAANRDPRRFDRPDELDVTRPRGPHLAFGHGVHQCLGQQLARVEMAVGFTGLLRRLPGLRLAVPAEQVPLRTDMIVYGVHSLPVAWDQPPVTTRAGAR